MSKYILGIDPGTTESGYAIIDDKYNIIESGKIDNESLLEKIVSPTLTSQIVIESIQSYGMTMGKSTIETCYFIGRLIQVCCDKQVGYKLIPRPEYGKAIIGGAKVNDALIRTALENRFGGYKKNEPLFKLAGATDKRSAFAVACYYLDKENNNV